MGNERTEETEEPGLICYHWDDNLRPPLEISNLLKNPEVRSVHGCWMFGNERMSEWGLKTHHIENPAAAAAAAANSSAVSELRKHWLQENHNVGHLGKETVDLLACNNRKNALSSQGEARSSFSVLWPVPSGMTGLGEEAGTGFSCGACCKRQPGLCYWGERGSLALEPTSAVPLPRGPVCASQEEEGEGGVCPVWEWVCVSEAVSTFSTSTHCSFFFPENRG